MTVTKPLVASASFHRQLLAYQPPNPLTDLTGSLDPYPWWFPVKYRFPKPKAKPKEQMTKEERLRDPDFFSREKALREVIQRYALKQWVEINQVVPFPLPQWTYIDRHQQEYGLDPIVQDALDQCVSDFNAKREKEAKEKEKKIESISMLNKPSLSFPQKFKT